jgi:hypothetical protein
MQGGMDATKLRCDAGVLLRWGCECDANAAAAAGAAASDGGLQHWGATLGIDATTLRCDTAVQR